MKIGITGHQRLASPDQWRWVQSELERVIASVARPDDTAFSSLAIGADQRFAELVLSRGLRLHVVIPCDCYEETFMDAPEKARYRDLLARAESKTVLPFTKPSEDAFLAAGRYIVESVDALLAVWNGRPAAGKGGTGDVVAHAFELGRRVIHLNPEIYTTVEIPAREQHDRG